MWARIKDKVGRSKSSSPHRDPGLAQPRSASRPVSPGPKPAASPTRSLQPILNTSPNPLLSTRDALVVSNVQTLSLEEERAAIWEKAYNDLYSEKPKLLDAYETILADESNLAHPANDGSTMPAENKLQILQGVVKAQRVRMENRQWTWALFGSDKTLRETVDTTLQLVQRSSALIGVGMTFAPPFISIPWSAISALVPLIANNSAEQQNAIKGLKQITDILFAYRIAEETLLVDPKLKPVFSDAVSTLYRQIIEYQAAATVYFGRNTLSRIGRDTLAGTRWAEAEAAVLATAENAKTKTDFLGDLQRKEAFESLKKILLEQSQQIADLASETASRNDETTQVLLWASNVQYYRDHSRVRADLTTLRKQWIMVDPKYCQWSCSDSGVLFLEGTVGKGKTSVTSEVIEDALQSAATKVAYFYCSKANPEDTRGTETAPQSDFLVAVRSIMAQLSLSADGITITSALLDRFRATPHRETGGCVLSTEECLTVLRAGLSDDPSKAWTIIVDALDECSKPAELLTALKSIVAVNPHTRLFLSSREGNLESVRQQYFPSLSDITITKQNDEDIEYFVTNQIAIRRPGTDLSDTQATELTKVLVDRADGMFKWVVLQLDLVFPRAEIAKPKLRTSFAAQIEKLRRSPLDSKGKLRETYREVFERATGEGNDEPQYEAICNALRWVLYAFRALTAQQLAYASSGCSDGVDSQGLTARFILINAANLLVETEYGDIRLAHLSVAEFLKQEVEVEFSPEEAHRRIALICCGNLNGPKAKNIAAALDQTTPTLPEARSSKTQENIRDWFHAYASKYWPTHCRRAALNDTLVSLIPPVGNVESLHEAIRSQDYGLLSAMIARKIDLETSDREGSSALHEAVRLGDDYAVQQLIHNGASMGTQNIQGDFPIHIAATLQSKSGLERLLRSGDDPNKPNRRGASALHIATYHNREDNVRILVGFGAVISPPAEGLETPLHFASHAGLVRIISPLIARAPDLNVPISNGDTALHLAARYGHTEVFDYLLAAGANHESLNKAGKSPMQLLQQAQARFQSDFSAEKILRNALEGQTKDFQSRALPGLSIVSGTFCKYCDVRKWFRPPRKGIKHDHHRNLPDLANSAKKCDMCRTFYQRLVPKADEVESAWNEVEISVELILTLDHGRSFAHDQDLLKVSLGNFSECLFELCVDGDSGLTGYIAGTALHADSGSSASLDLVQSWLDRCEKSHDLCWTVENHTGLSKVIVAPKRLVDIGTSKTADGTLHLLEAETMPQRDSYGFLSHQSGDPKRWDNSQILKDRKVMLHDLERSMQDAVKTFRRVGIRYMWVDKLCINAADETEMETEGDRIADYVRASAFVINAGARLDSDGLFEERKDQGNLLHLRVEWSNDETNSSKITDSLYLRSPLSGPEECFSQQVLARAWMLQELSLPRHVVLYGQDQVYWKCREMMCCEGSRWTSRPQLDFGHIRDIPRSERMDRAARRQNEDQWYLMLELYSVKQLSKWEDRLNPTRGMAKALTFSYSVGSYESGLWSSDLHRGLLWYAATVRHAKRPAATHIFPTWSWASLDGGISFSMMWGLSKVVLPILPTPAFFKQPSDVAKTLKQPSDVAKRLKKQASKAHTTTSSNWQINSPDIQSHVMEEWSWEIILIKNAPWKLLSSADLAQPTSLQILFDTWDDEVSWRSGGQGTCVLINTWSSGEGQASKRWVGLLLAETEVSGVQGYMRRGLVLGPWLDESTEGWSFGFHGALL